jgi:PHP family Zn ribbon phosphoesterase
VLVDAPLDNFHKANLDDRVVEAIAAFRGGEIRVIPGGGGKYGVIELKPKGSEMEEEEVGGERGRGQKGQRSLLDF